MVSVVFCHRYQCVLFRLFQSRMHQKQNLFQKSLVRSVFYFSEQLGCFSWKRKVSPLESKIQAENVKKYGKVFRNKLPGVEIISLSDPADVAKLLRSDPKYPERMDFPSLNFYREIRNEIPGVFFVNGEE